MKTLRHIALLLTVVCVLYGAWLLKLERDSLQFAAEQVAHDAYCLKFQQAMPVTDEYVRRGVALSIGTNDFVSEVIVEVNPRPTGGPGPGSFVSVWVQRHVFFDLIPVYGTCTLMKAN